jgi:hypothetical protein
VGIIAKTRFLSSVGRHSPGELADKFRLGLFSKEETYVLRRDLAIPLTPPRAKIAIEVRQAFVQHDMEQFKADGLSGLHWGVMRVGLLQPYVAVTRGGEICYIQWLITPEHREQLQSIRFRRATCFDDDTVALEFAYTFKRFRGQGIMSPAMAAIAEQDKRARCAVTYVPCSNTASIRGCRGAGFLPYQQHFDHWVLFHRCTSKQDVG